MPSLELSTTYVCLAPDGGASTIDVTPDFWNTIDDREDLKEGRLVAVFESAGDWPYWEMHPEGEEILVLLSGEMTMIFEGPSAERRVKLLEGRACLVPRGVWHRAIRWARPFSRGVPVQSRLLSITYGRGTRHRER